VGSVRAGFERGDETHNGAHSKCDGECGSIKRKKKVALVGIMCSFRTRSIEVRTEEHCLLHHVHCEHAWFGLQLQCMCTHHVVVRRMCVTPVAAALRSATAASSLPRSPFIGADSPLPNDTPCSSSEGVAVDAEAAAAHATKQTVEHHIGSCRFFVAITSSTFRS
jgi:hypothetical protein